MEVNFDSLPKVSGGNFKFKNPGDSLKGTLVGKKQKPDQYNAGQEVTIIEVKTQDGKIMSYFCNNDVAREISHVKLGQFVKIAFIKQLPPRTPGLQGKKIIEVYSDESLVDTAWLAEQADETAVNEAAEAFGGSVMPAVPSFVDDGPEANPIETIKQLAKLKIPGTTDANYQAKVMEALGVAFVSMNYGKIIEMLK
jgi:hypothetical protein